MDEWTDLRTSVIMYEGLHTFVCLFVGFACLLVCVRYSFGG